MTRTDKVKKQCDRCGHKVFTARLNRVCKQLERNSHGFRTGYRCPGRLKVVARRKRDDRALPPVPAGKGLGYVLSEEYQQQSKALRGQRGRARAAKELAAAEARQKEWLQESKRIENLCRKWTKKVRRLKARSTWTDEQFELERETALKALQVGHVKRRLAKSAGIKAQADGAQ